MMMFKAKMIALATTLLLMTGAAKADLNTGLVAYYPFNGNANDVSGNNNHGILNGGVTLSQDKLGNENSAYYFDGVSGYISVPNKKTLNPANQVTISLWVRLDNNINGWMPLIDKGGTGSSGLYYHCYLFCVVSLITSISAQ
jgi:hypothetical protein